MKTVVEMAREAGAIHIHKSSKEFAVVGNEAIERFAELARADEREKYKWDIHSCGPDCKRYACVSMREAVEAEREACAKVCDDWPNGRDDVYSIGVAIRARSNT
jgi:hypothetical protein